MNIKEYYHIDDPTCSEEIVYNAFKNNTSWKCLILSVRLCELYYVLPQYIQTIIRGIYRIIFWRKLVINDEYIALVNKWEK